MSDIERASVKNEYNDGGGSIGGASDEAELAKMGYKQELQCVPIHSGSWQWMLTITRISSRELTLLQVSNDSTSTARAE
jgi:hypothetical protein